MRTAVVATAQLTPDMVRVEVAGPDLARFTPSPYTDAYVKCRFGDCTRSYTVRAFDVEDRRLTLDFVTHGKAGVAGRWAAGARPGDELLLTGPGGAYAPSPDADWHLMVGDESVIPAIAVSLPQVPANAPVFVLLEVDGPDHELTLETPGRLQLKWLHRSGRAGEQPELLSDAVRALELPGGRGHAFVHGEASSVLNVRGHLIRDRGLAPGQLSATGYWKYRLDDEQWRAEKSGWIAQAKHQDDAH